jgi:prepilin-type N-terminal cleavage/methylation domain-containing protein
MCDLPIHLSICSTRPRMRRCGSAVVRRAFTLVEILIVVVILGILATIIVPHVTSASQQTRENALRDDVRYLRMQIIVYKAQHHEVAPGYPTTGVTGTPTAALFQQQMTTFSDERGATSATSSGTYKFGPYVGALPVNPVNQKATVLVVANGAAVPAPTGAYGWIYKPETEEIYPDVVGNDMNGIPYFNY